MKNARLPLIGLGLMFAAPAFADDVATVLGAAIGGAAGTAISQNTHQSRNATILWSAVGAGTGAAVGRSLGQPHSAPVIDAPRYAQPYYAPAATTHYAPAQQAQYVSGYHGNNYGRATQAHGNDYQAYRDDGRRGHAGRKKHQNRHERSHDDDDD